MFIERSLSRHLGRIGSLSRIVMVTGPRQVGKSTLLKQTLPHARYVTLDDPELRALATTEPKVFLDVYKPPLIIDEIQYAPELFPILKMKVDEDQTPGQYWMSGSQAFEMMKNVNESLAGRVAILPMFGLSTRELLRDADAPLLIDRLDDFGRPVMDAGELYKLMWRGGFPELHAKKALDPQRFYSDYVQTYLQRDLRDIANVGDQNAFLTFMRLVAARTGQVLNVSELARAAAISPSTADRWLSILETSTIIKMLHTAHGSMDKRMVKQRKLYMTDTGLAAWLAGWNSPDALMNGAAAGAFLETYAVNEITKGYLNRGLRPDMSYYRNRDTKEVDILIVQNATVYPFEVKSTSRPDRRVARTLQVAGALGLKQGPGGIICLAPKAYPLSENVTAFPIGLL